MWSKLNDTLFCREILLCEPLRFKVRSTERKKAWETIADNLHAIEDPKFRVTVTEICSRSICLPNLEKVKSAERC